MFVVVFDFLHSLLSYAFPILFLRDCSFLSFDSEMHWFCNKIATWSFVVRFVRVVSLFVGWMMPY